MIRWTLRTLKVFFISIVILVVTLFVLIQFQQRLLRHRAEQLLTDIHKIKLYESSWQDAQRLMQRWGAWGHYDGQCTEHDCRYTITLSAPAADFQYELLRRLQPIRAFRLYSWLGGRYFDLQFKFIVQDGKIWRTLLWANLVVPPRTLAWDDYGYSLVIKSKSRSTVGNLSGGAWVPGTEEQLAKHPTYKAGRPHGCYDCMSVEVTYSTRSPQPEVLRLTSLNLDCLTRWRPCELPEELFLPALEWHLWDSPERYEATKPSDSAPPNPCDIPIWALGRDAKNAVVVDTLTSELIDEPNYRAQGESKSFEQAQVKIVSSLKGIIPLPIGTVITVDPYPGEDGYPPFHLPDHLIPGKRYVLLSTIGEQDSKLAFYAQRCSIHDFNPGVVNELRKGFAENDSLRGPEL